MYDSLALLIDTIPALYSVSCHPYSGSVNAVWNHKVRSSTSGCRSIADPTFAGYGTRSKRQAQSVDVHNDENNDPAHDQIAVDSPSVQASKTLSSVSITTPKKIRSVGRPAKHGAPNTRVQSPPNTINAHFSVSKASIERPSMKDSVIASPHTPRHHDALSKKVEITPRARVQVAGTPRTPQTPRTPSDAPANPYNRARQLFSSCGITCGLVGRDDEKRQVADFVSQRLDSKDGGCLYVSGPPGTGKSALVSDVLGGIKDRLTSAVSVVNCMSVKNAADLSQKLSSDLNLTISKRRASDFDDIRTHFFASGASASKHVVVLDEVDRLVDLDLKLLYNLFEWSMEPASNLVLIGIANALDLTDRLLPRLKSRNIKPDLLPFMPYTATQITHIITTKLKTLNDITSADQTPFLHPAAIQFCSKKVAAQTGDLRKAFDICKRAIDLAEQDAKTEQARLALQDSPSKTPLAENINLSSPPVQRSPQKTPRQLKLSSSLSHLTIQTAPRATIAHMAKVTSSVFSNGASQRLQTLNIQQKAVLCALSGYEKQRRDMASQTTLPSTPSKHAAASASPTVKQLYEIYTRLCKRENLLHPLTSVEFRDVLGGLETLSLVSAVEGRNGSFAVPLTPSRTPSRKGRASGAFAGTMGMGDEKRMASCVGHGELMTSLQGPGSEILRDILDGGVV